MKAGDAIYHGADRRDMLPFIPAAAKRILELGCGAGNFGMLIKQHQSVEIWGVEMDPAAAVLAKTKLDQVLVGDIAQVLKDLPAHAFDCIVANDVLEHMAWPDRLLHGMKEKMSPRGVLVASIPNIRHWRSLFEILVLGDFRYRDWGIFDRTHLRFFTKKSIRRLFADAGYRMEKIIGISPSGPAAFLPLSILNVLLLGTIADWRYVRFAVVAGPEQ